MEIIVTMPQSYAAERDYILSVILRDFLGLDYNVQRTGQIGVCVSDSAEKRRLIIPDGLFAVPEEQWLTQESLPKRPLKVWDPLEMAFDKSIAFAPVPIIYGANGSDINKTNYLYNGTELRLPVDIFGSCFFMLTRYEELVNPDRDEHDRFPAKASLAYKEGFIQRAIVNEYLEILWACMKFLWPCLRRKERSYRVLLTHDVDSALSSFNPSLLKLIKSSLGDVIKRRSFSTGINRVSSRLRREYSKDPFNTFDFFMDTSEKYGIKSCFNFMGSIKENRQCSNSDSYNPWVRSLLLRISTRGHEIGFHASEGSYQNLHQTRSEFQKLKSACKEVGVTQREYGGRQHMLQWQNPETWRIWDKTGLIYDSSLGFPENPGFRCGICYEYPAFDLAERKRLDLHERPLIAMDTSFFSYMGYDLSATADMLTKLSQVCKKFDGDFVCLWHNSKIITPRLKEWYRRLVPSLL